MPSSTRVLTALLAVLVILTSPLGASDWSSVVAKIRPSLAYLEIFDVEGGFAGSCTAFSINDEKDYFLTADHCQGASMSLDGKQAIVIYADVTSDLMVLVVPDSGSYPALKLAEEVKPGEAIAAYGWGFGLEFPTLNTGVVSAVATKFPRIFESFGYGSPDEIYTLFDFSLIHGESGGPVVNDKGEVISIAQIGLPDGIGAGRSFSELLANVGKYWTSKK